MNNHSGFLDSGPSDLRSEWQTRPSPGMTRGGEIKNKRVTQKEEFQGLRRWENRSVLLYMRIFESSVTLKLPFWATLFWLHCKQCIMSELFVHCVQAEDHSTASSFLRTGSNGYSHLCLGIHIHSIIIFIWYSQRIRRHVGQRTLSSRGHSRWNAGPRKCQCRSLLVPCHGIETYLLGSCRNSKGSRTL